MTKDQNTFHVKKGNSYIKKIKKAFRIYNKEGFQSFVKELWLVAIRPLRLIREDRVWNLLLKQNKSMPPMVVVNEAKMFLNPNDKGISKELANYHEHEPLTTRIMKEIISPGDTIIDIGANIGYFALFESQLVGLQGKIIAIEPSPENVKLLKLNIKENKNENVHVIEAAIGDYDGVGTLYLSEACNWNSLVVQSELGQTGIVEVEVRTIDSLIKSMGVRPSLIRMDIEGYEPKAIKGMLNTINNYAPRLVIELHPQLIGGEATRDLILTLQGFGYDVLYAIEKERDFSWNAAKQAIEALSIDILLNDSRLIEEERGFMVFLQKKF